MAISLARCAAIVLYRIPAFSFPRCHDDGAEPAAKEGQLLIAAPGVRECYAVLGGNKNYFHTPPRIYALNVGMKRC